MTFKVMMLDSVGGSLDQTQLKTFKLVWRTKAPSKVGVFGWRLLQQRLPT